MLITIFTLITFLFFVIVLVFFSLFLDKKEFIWKLIYLISAWGTLFFLAFWYSEYFLITFENYLWDLIFLKNFQDLLTIKLEFALFIANNGVLYVLAWYLYFLVRDYFYANELFALKIMLFSFFYLNIYSFLVTRFDIFLSNWELLQKDLLLNKIDIQIDYLLFFHEFFDDCTDLCNSILFAYAILGIMLFNKINVHRLRILLYLLVITFEIYYFGFISIPDLIFLCLLTFFSIESILFFYLMTRILHKINVKHCG